LSIVVATSALTFAAVAEHFVSCVTTDLLISKQWFKATPVDHLGDLLVLASAKETVRPFSLFQALRTNSF
jgi:hypothetical protein